MPACPLSHRDAVELYFLEHRAKVLDLAAFLDRLDRAAPPPDGREDFRVSALRAAIGILQDGHGERARRVLELLSDHSTEPIARAPMQGAFGAPPSNAGGAR